MKNRNFIFIYHKDVKPPFKSVVGLGGFVMIDDSQGRRIAMTGERIPGLGYEEQIDILTEAEKMVAVWNAEYAEGKDGSWPKKTQ